MRDTSLYFELGTIALLLLGGVSLLLQDLPGTGLLCVSGLLMSLSLGLRHSGISALAKIVSRDS